MAIDDDLYNIANAMDIVSESNDGLVRSFANLSESGKGWTVFSRLVSGSGLWRLQNKVRAVSDILFIFYRRQDEGLKSAIEQARKLSTLSKEYEKLSKIVDTKSFDRTEEFQTYKLAFEQILEPAEAHKQALLLTERAYQSTYDKMGKIVEKFGQNLVKGLTDPKILAAQEEINLAQAAIDEDKKSGRAVTRRRTISSSGRRFIAGKFAERRLRRTKNPLEEKTLKEMTKLKEINAKQFERFKKGIGEEIKLRKNLLKAKVGKKITQIGVGIRKIAMVAAKLLLVFTVVSIAAFFIFQFFSKNGPSILERFKNLGSLLSKGFESIQTSFQSLVENATDLYRALVDGDFLQFLISLGKVFLDILLIVGKVLLTGLVAVLGSLVAIVMGTFDKAFAETENFLEALVSTFLQIGALIGAILLIIGIIASFSWVPMLAIAIGTAIMGALGFASTGGTVTTPLTVVGERGPEIVSLPKGSQVTSNAQSKNMRGGVTNNITVQVQGRIGASDQEIRDIAKKVGEHINREINRHTSSGVRRYG